MDYKSINLEYCFIQYHTNNIACECDADMEKVIFKKEK